MKPGDPGAVNTVTSTGPLIGRCGSSATIQLPCTARGSFALPLTDCSEVRPPADGPGVSTSTWPGSVSAMPIFALSVLPATVTSRLLLVRCATVRLATPSGTPLSVKA